MQAFRLSTRLCQIRTISNTTRRCLSASTNSSAQNTPWFVDQSDEPIAGPSSFDREPSHHQPAKPWTPHSHPNLPLPPVPSEIANDSPIRRLHAQLATSPFLEPGTLTVRKSVPTEIGPPLPPSGPKGRRKRGRTYAGEGMLEADTSIWRHVVIAEVKEGTENRGAIESVLRVVRKTLLTSDPPLPLPPNRKRIISNGWAMIDAGEFAVHVVSRRARERYFPEVRTWA